jgi:glutaminyl-peptide cyclotransferase
LHYFIIYQQQGLLFLFFITNNMIRKYAVVAGIILLSACNNTTTDNPGDDTPSEPPVPAPQNIGFKIDNVYPHDTSAFTEGLQLVDGKLYEGTGDYIHSTLQIADIKTGKVLQQHRMGTADIFGEGIQVFKDKIYQMTYKNNIVYVYDKKDITKPIKTLKWASEGWGMTNDGTSLIVSDGTTYIYYVNPEDFGIQKHIQVVDNTGPVDNINELEYIDGFIYANVFTENVILKINPANGHVVGTMNCEGLLQQYAAKEIAQPGFSINDNVLNGIAWDSAARKMYITGKRWPKLFELSFN